MLAVVMGNWQDFDKKREPRFVLDSSDMFTLFMISGSDWASLASVEASLLETFGLGTFAQITEFLARDLN